MICKKTDSLIKVMKVINKSSKGIAFVVNEENKICGVVTDGDIRRALLNEMQFDDQIQNIISKDFVFGYTDDSYESMIKKVSNKIKIIPVLNKNGNIVDYFECSKNFRFPIANPNFVGNEFNYLLDAFMSSWISSTGQYINKFEGAFANYVDCNFGVSVSNGTAALQLALASLGVGKGDEVIVPNLTFASPINVVIHANATPVVVDIESESWCIDPYEIEKAITPKTKAIIPVHLYGQPADMDSIMSLAKKHNLFVIEDCAEAHGAIYANKKVGSIGDIGCFSFYGNKVITTGEGGMCVTNNSVLNTKLALLRDHGMSKTKRYWHEVVGYNYRMTNLQAAIGLGQLEKIETIHANRREFEKVFRDIFRSNQNVSFQRNNLQNRKRITWLVNILLNSKLDRDTYINKFSDIGIDARPFFYPLNEMKIYKKYCSSSYYPVANEVSRNGISLPAYGWIESIEGIKEKLKDFSI